MNDSVVKFIAGIFLLAVFVVCLVFIPLAQAFALNVLLPAVFSLPYNFTTWSAIVIFNWFWMGNFAKAIEGLVNRNKNK